LTVAPALDGQYPSVTVARLVRRCPPSDPHGAAVRNVVTRGIFAAGAVHSLVKRRLEGVPEFLDKIATSVPPNNSAAVLGERLVHFLEAKAVNAVASVGAIF